MKIKGKKCTYHIPSDSQYATLQWIANGCKFLSFTVLFVAILLLVIFLITLLILHVFFEGVSPAQIIVGLFFVPLLLIHFLIFVFFRILSEMIWVHLDITMNTYHAAIIVEQLLRSKG